jgi:hypothetical protein
MYESWSQPQKQCVAYWNPCAKKVTTTHCTGGQQEDTAVLGNVVVSVDEVTSWRGKKDVKESRSFERFSYKLNGGEELRRFFVCAQHHSYDTYRCKDGGTGWIEGVSILSPSHPCWMSSPPDLGYESYRLTDDQRRYRNYVITKLFGKANKPRFNGATFLAELGESIYYIRDILMQVVKMAKFTKGIIRRGANPEEAWLEWRYAVQPLMLAVEDVVEAMQQQRPRSKVQTFKNFGEKVVRNEHLFTYNPGTLLFRSKYTTRFRAGAALWINSQHDPSPWGGSLNDMIQAGWEIVPASFIIDWFIGVGAWLASLRNTNIDLGNRYATLVCEHEYDVWVDTAGSTANWTFYNWECPTENDPITVRSHTISRIIGDDVSPSFLPGLYPGKQTLLHKLDALALTVALIKGLRR